MEHITFIGSKTVQKGKTMKTELILSLTTTFEGHAQQTDGGVEFWLARDLQYLLGYAKWDNFLNVVSRAKIDHFPDVGKMVSHSMAGDFARSFSL